jgi:hypothetical protein
MSFANYGFGDYVRSARSAEGEADGGCSPRQRGQPRRRRARLSEHGRARAGATATEGAILRLAAHLGEDRDMLLAMAGKLSSKLQKNTAAEECAGLGHWRCLQGRCATERGDGQVTDNGKGCVKNDTGGAFQTTASTTLFPPGLRRFPLQHMEDLADRCRRTGTRVAA